MGTCSRLSASAATRVTMDETEEPVRCRLEIRQEVHDLCQQFGIALPEGWVSWDPPPADERLVPGFQQELPL